MSILTQNQLVAVNENFELDLDYGNATHYRAASIIYNLWKIKDPDQAETAAEDIQAKDPNPADSALSYQGSNDDTDD
ncbi:hypothetical protein CLW00_101207 [Mongoliibacter ruber]|uniref:Uncharacterized protein n=1 Tax=Mongoliibacter ruber TaxID=1750599 RepID=A0A2T0WV32_9BACT|nr:hypothetical protein CLW00_101207 [Mongoliibacter ruber]